MFDEIYVELKKKKKIEADGKLLWQYCRVLESIIEKRRIHFYKLLASHEDMMDLLSSFALSVANATADDDPNLIKHLHYYLNICVAYHQSLVLNHLATLSPEQIQNAVTGGALKHSFMDQINTKKAMDMITALIFNKNENLKQIVLLSLSKIIRNDFKVY